jgi:hypothetical protein
LDVWYAAVPAAENAGLKFLEVRDLFIEPVKGSDPGEVDWMEIPHTQALDAKTITILEDHLAKNAETLRLMREAAKMERSRYPMDLSNGSSKEFLGGNSDLALIFQGLCAPPEFSCACLQ